MKKNLLSLFLCLISGTLIANAQGKKLLTEINSIHTKNIISLRYNTKNQLVYFDERGTVSYCEFTLKYDKTNNRLVECSINRDKGEMIINSKFIYNNEEYITEEIKKSGKQLRKGTEYNKIYIDANNKLIKTTFEDGQLWEEFFYDANNNLSKYLVHSASGNNDIKTEYKFDTNNSIFSNIEDLPSWFWTLHMNSMKWCGDFSGKNNAIESTTQDARFGTDTIEITYEYDQDGYPVKQYYDGELVKEFRYKTI